MHSKISLSVAIVFYGNDFETLKKSLLSIAQSNADTLSINLTLIDNGPADNARALREVAAQAGCEARVISTQGNVGFGRAHNLMLDQLGEFHLILNPDVELASHALTLAIGFMQDNPQCGLLTPSAHYESGERQYLCKRYPSLFNLLVRGFFPQKVRALFAKRLARYEMRDLIGEADVAWNPPIVSGCFMLFRSAVLRETGGFDPRYFLYFEDFDLSLRAGKITQIAYVPSVRIIHHGGHAARKGLWHIKMFGQSAALFFNTHGWKLF